MQAGKTLGLSLRSFVKAGTGGICRKGDFAEGLKGCTQVRFAHTDLEFPSQHFDEYRRKSTLDPTVPAKDTATGRQMFCYLHTGGALLCLAYISKQTVRGLAGALSPAADVLALAKVEIKIADIPEGKSMTFSWRGKPIFVKHRTEAEIQKERAVDLSSLRDPQHDNDRIVDPKWLVVIGVCTHLGCIPIAEAGDYGGYYCPCHGSHYDGSGRIRKGPAPLNLEVPEYSFLDPGVIVVG